ncbi:MAG: hypothetical protein GY803_23700 [Chloroflexi bacterium]|nr:hypothetical protein [Chloroflexota bacterium]
MSSIQRKDLFKHSSPIHPALTGLAVLLLVPLVMLEGNLRCWAEDTANNPLTVNFSHPTGVYEQATILRLTTAHPDAQIFFTADGSPPLPETATAYIHPLQLPADPANVAAVRARAFLPNGEMGPVASASYFMGIEASVPMISLLTAPSNLWDEEKGLITNSLEDGREWERPVTMIYLTENGRLGFQTDAGIRIHGSNSRYYDKNSFRLYFRRDYGLPWLRFPIFPNSDVNEFKRLVLHAGGQDYPQYKANGTLLRSRLAANLAEQANIYRAQSRPVILFLNGQLWGVYNLREYINDNFFNSHFGIESSTGDVENWKHLERYVQSHDLSDPANYAYIQTQIDVANFIDYIVMQTVMANNDWPEFNISRFRGHSPGGRWQFMFWDMDYAFGLTPGSHVEYNMVNHVLNDTPWFLFSALLENPEFHDRFLSRMADLLNSPFRPENVIAEIDRLAAEMEPNIHWETTRWPGSGDWAASVEEMREFARRRPDIMRQHVVEGFDLAGTAVFTFNPAPSGGGAAVVNDYLLPEAPWEGAYFAGTKVLATAVPQPGYQFAGWKPATLPQTAVIVIPVTTADQTITPLFERISSKQ